MGARDSRVLSGHTSLYLSPFSTWICVGLGGWCDKGGVAQGISIVGRRSNKIQEQEGVEQTVHQWR